MREGHTRVNPVRRAAIHDLYERPMSGEAIEARSLLTVDREAGSHAFAPEQWEVVRRMIHATADFGLVESVRFSPDAIESGIAALRAGSRIYVDSTMIRSGLSLARLKEVNREYGLKAILCYVAHARVAAEAKRQGLPRSLFAVRKAGRALHGGIAVFGNAPVALLEINRMIMEEALRPALVIAMPVGFVHVTESKEELMSLGVPYIAISGRRGGSPLAVSAIHALCSLAIAGQEGRGNEQR